jgi:predicted O-methyltransferase YrrM
MPDAEGELLYEIGCSAGRIGPLVEIGSYCGKSALYLGAAARSAGTVLFSIDHHRGSEEQQPGEEFHDAQLVDDQGRVDTLPCFRRTISAAGLEDVIVAIVAMSHTIAAHWATPLGLVFIDGGHSEDAVTADFDGWAPKLLAGGLLAIHDVFPDPMAGGQAPFHLYQRALASGQFREHASRGSLKVLQRL